MITGWEVFFQIVISEAACRCTDYALCYLYWFIIGDAGQIINNTIRHIFSGGQARDAQNFPHFLLCSTHSIPKALLQVESDGFLELGPLNSQHCSSWKTRLFSLQSSQNIESRHWVSVPWDIKCDQRGPMKPGLCRPRKEGRLCGEKALSFVDLLV